MPRRPEQEVRSGLTRLNERWAGERAAAAAADDHDSEMMKAIAAAVQMQEEAPDLKSDAADSQVLSHLHAARAAQQRDMDGHAASGGY